MSGSARNGTQLYRMWCNLPQVVRVLLTTCLQTHDPLRFLGLGSELALLAPRNAVTKRRCADSAAVQASQQTAGKRRYRRKPERFVFAVQLDLDIADGKFVYHKWGGDQVCKKNDWIVNNDGECYTVDEHSFKETYTPVEQARGDAKAGKYVKTMRVWAVKATSSDTTITKEGQTSYKEGDYVVWNREDGSDMYAMGPSRFESLYEVDK
jgi:hypothetical protein